MGNPLAQALAESQFYKNKPKGLSAIKPPSEYGLIGYEETQLSYGKDQRLHLWEHHVGSDKPTIVMFHGVNGHWGEIHGKVNEKAKLMRIEWLKSLPEDVNIIAVSMPGFGKSTGEPSRASFDAANAALIEKLKNDKIDFKTISARGESMGANHALNFAKQAYEAGNPIAQVDAVVPFTTSANATADFLGSALGNVAGLTLRNTGHDHDNLKEVEALRGSGTKIMVLAAGEEVKVSPPIHQSKLAFTAATVGLCATLVTDKEAHHTNWDKAKAQAASTMVAAGTCQAVDEPLQFTAPAPVTRQPHRER